MEKNMVSNCCGALPIGEIGHDDLGFCSKCRDHAVFVDEEENNDILVTEEWYRYYRECARKLRLILRIIDYTDIARDDDTMNTIIGEAHRDMRKLADVLDPEEKKEWLSRVERADKDASKKQIPNEENKSFDIGAYKRECIDKLKTIAVGKTLLVEDRIYQTVEWWIRGMENTKEEFKDKKFHVEGVNHNTQLIRRIK